MTPLAALLAERIRRLGPITFAEYMRECLYHPAHGYYSRPEARRFADYYTSVDINPVFGRLLARQFAEMWEQLGRPPEFLLLETAAGTGRLARYILQFAEKRLPDFFGALRYVAVELSAARREQLAASLSRFVAPGKCHPSNEIPPRIPAGCVFSNELIDALPVHRVEQQAGALKELFVAHGENGFREIPQALSQIDPGLRTSPARACGSRRLVLEETAPHLRSVPRSREFGQAAGVSVSALSGRTTKRRHS